MNPISRKNSVLVIALVMIAGIIGYVEIQKAKAPERGAILATETTSTLQAASSQAVSAPQIQSAEERKKDKAKKYLPAREITPGGGFFNSPPFQLKDFIGKKVILVDFWTYTCINCRRTTPYLNAWYQKYKDLGFVIVGVHTPEFEFEKVYTNVAKDIAEEGIQYPNLQDNDRATWDTYQNQYWPHEYLIDIDGYIIHDKIGEGGYDESERAIQAALKERAQALDTSDVIPTSIVSPQDIASVDTSRPISPETYFGAARNQYLGNGAKGVLGPQMLSIPASLQSNTLYLGGGWNFQNEYAENMTPGARIQFKYNAKNVYLVATADTPVTITLKRDGHMVSSERGKAVAKDGTIVIQTNRLYHLIQEAGYQGEHTLEIDIQGQGIKAFAFTFG